MSQQDIVILIVCIGSFIMGGLVVGIVWWFVKVYNKTIELDLFDENEIVHSRESKIVNVKLIKNGEGGVNLMEGRYYTVKRDKKNDFDVMYIGKHRVNGNAIFKIGSHVDISVFDGGGIYRVGNSVGDLNFWGFNNARLLP